ncbi:MAG: hypothetical protein KDG52_05300 [Rhodocyclaceae bacterium]|nr:hypothetical protein [Rhodocyclaceae bacterium]
MKTPDLPASDAETAPTGDRPRPPIEIGWTLVDLAAEFDGATIHEARRYVLEEVERIFPKFDWRLTVIRAAGDASAGPADAPELFQRGLTEHDRHGWDFSCVLTGRSLLGYERPDARAMPSRALSIAVVSLAGLLPAPAPPASAAARRLAGLFLHLLGDLNGIAHGDDPDDYMAVPADPAGFETMGHFHDGAVAALGAELEDVADIRLEERAQPAGRNAVAFYLQAMWLLRGEILSGVWQARPWQFPVRLNRLTTGAVSTLMILIMTAEAWDLGMGQPLARMAAFSLFVLVATSAFILRRQQLLLTRSTKLLSEHIVLTDTAIALVVFFGMATTYLMLFSLTLLLANWLFSDALVASWAASLPHPPAAGNYLALAQLIASLGILIGSLGASFEGRDFFRHVAYVDEEL